MAFVAQPSDLDHIVDPVCGTGTLISEAVSLAPSATVIGIDRNPDAIEAARHNLRGIKSVSLEIRDSRHTSLSNDSVTLVIANLPFGKQFGDRHTNPALYFDLITEWLRTAAPDRWRAVVLSSDVGAFRAASSRFSRLRIKEIFRVRIRGELATVFLLTR